ncbi:ABC transporter permease, partial [Photobacterium damselae]
MSELSPVDLNNQSRQRKILTPAYLQPYIRVVVTLGLLLCLWQGTIWLFSLPSFILPSPIAVLDRLYY